MDRPVNIQPWSGEIAGGTLTASSQLVPTGVLTNAADRPGSGAFE